MGEGWRGEHSLAQVMMGMFEAGGPVSASALRLMETGRHSHRAVDAMRQVRSVHGFGHVHASAMAHVPIPQSFAAVPYQ